MTDGEPETAVSASLQKIKSIININQHNFFLNFIYLIKSHTSNSFVNYFNGHFVYLKTLDFSFNGQKQRGGTTDIYFCSSLVLW